MSARFPSDSPLEAENNGMAMTPDQQSTFGRVCNATWAGHSDSESLSLVEDNEMAAQKAAILEEIRRLEEEEELDGELDMGAEEMEVSQEDEEEPLFPTPDPSPVPPHEAGELPVLSVEALKLVEQSLELPGDAELANLHGTPVSVRDLQTLLGTGWLNDEIMNHYCLLMVERGKAEGGLKTHAFNSFFYPKLESGGYAPLSRWTRRIDLFNFDLILVPIHLGLHWCMAIIDLLAYEIRYYDSMGSPNDTCLELLQMYLESEHMDKKKVPLPHKYRLLNVPDLPQQENGFDCGVFASQFANHISARRPLSFNQTKMSYFRKRMMCEIVTGSLL